MGIPRGVKWWIPGLGLLVTATAITAGFGWSISNATLHHAEEALETAGIAGVDVSNDYRDVTLSGPCRLKDAALGEVSAAPLVQTVVYVVPVIEGSAPTPAPSPSATPAPSPSATPAPSPSADLAAAMALLEETLSGHSRLGFAFESAALSPGAASALDSLADVFGAALAEDPGLRLVVAGHTDSVGERAYNVRLSDARANAVLDYLASRGIPADALVASGYGEARPIADNGTAAGRAANRRVELTIQEG